MPESLFLIKLQAEDLQLYKRDIWAGLFLCIFTKFLKTPFLWNIFERLLQLFLESFPLEPLADLLQVCN